MKETLTLNNNAVIKIKILSPQECMHIYGIPTDQTLFQLLLLKSSSVSYPHLEATWKPTTPLSSAACLTILGGSWYLNQEGASASVIAAFNLYNDSTKTLIIQANNSCYNSGSKGHFWSFSSHCFPQTKLKEKIMAVIQGGLAMKQNNASLGKSRLP